ncbi:IS5 family transposase, partial [Nocardiopsis rhodophaea]|uniref:IS5 family transposase n=1 Tax=Nocardiopsis rhodophaea TaxID=280238 RepID=UPI00399CBD68
MSRRFELTDAEWEQIKPFLPATEPRRGGRWRDHRQVLNGILFGTRTGVPWRDLPERYGPWRTVYKRFRRWEADGTWHRIEAHLIGTQDTDLHTQIDSTAIRAHQHAAGAWKRGHRNRTHDAPQGIGRSRAGLSTKVHTLADGNGRNLATALTPGQDGDAPLLAVLLGRVRIMGPGAGRPRTRVRGVSADKAYSSRANRELLRKKGMKCTIPEREDQKSNRKARGRSGGRPPAFDREAYRDRNRVERLMDRRKQLRAVATRFDKLASSYRVTVRIADIFIRLRASPDRSRAP